MNIIPAVNAGNIASNVYPTPFVQNTISVHLSNQRTPVKSPPRSTAKSDEEKKHIRDLLVKLPGLTKIFDLHHKIGEGAFSSVFLASLKCHSHLPEDQKKLFAIKHLVPTSHPNRILQELKCLKYIGGCENVVGIDFCMRKFDTVIFVMPYLPHTKFSEYVLKMDVMETKIYMKNLLLALRRVHQFNIIHRDVKPSNFLYDRENKKFLLVDFGLAQKIDAWPPTPKKEQEDTMEMINCTNNYSVPSQSDNLEATNPPSVTSNKRKYCEMYDLQPTNDIEPNPKKPLLDGSGMTCNSYPLKPLQGDHPKISPSNSSMPMKSPVISPKLAAARRQVFADSNENGHLMQTESTVRFENTHQPPQIEVPPINNLNQYYGQIPYYNALNYSMINPYQQLNYPSCATAQKLSQYYSYYNAIKYSNFLASSMYESANVMNGQNGLCNMYKAQVNNNAIHNNYIDYNALHNCNFNAAASVVGMPAVNSNYTMPVNPYDNKAINNMTEQKKVSNNAKKIELGKIGVRSSGKSCSCKGRAMVCSVCLGRGAHNAPRAGTQGFRPPEVLLKYAEQTTAVDLWASGVILLSVVSGCYPFFRAPDDLTALAEMITVFGSRRLKDVANVLGRHLMCSYTKRPLDIRKLCSHLRYRALKTNNPGNKDLPGANLLMPQAAQPQGDIRNEYMHPSASYINNEIMYAQQAGFSQIPVDSCKQMKNANANVRNTYMNSMPGQTNGRTSAKVFLKGTNNPTIKTELLYGKPNKKSKNCLDCALPLNSCVCAFEDIHLKTIDKTISSTSAPRNFCGFPEEAFDLLERLLDLNPHTRITASEALSHPFLANL